jgi:tryptophan-rich hypothetical protein
VTAPIAKAPERNRLSPKKLLLSKWTAVTPRRKEKHFLVIKVLDPEPPATKVDAIELQAVHSRRTRIMPWRDLADRSQWLPGWV